MRYWFLLILFSFILITCKFPNRYGPIVEYQKGMSVPSWKNDEYLRDSVTISFLALQELGTTHIAIIPTWYQLTISSNEIYPTSKTPSDSALRRVILLAHSMGLNIMLKPHLDVENNISRNYILPANLSQWFSSYLRFILHYAKIAQELSVKEFCIGTELQKISTRPEWKILIDTLRKVYHGKLTYAANWDEYPKVNFWQHLDYIGINGYFPLAENREATIEEYLENFQLWLAQIDNFHSKVNKNIIITEIGFRSIKGSGVRPYDWQTQGIMDENSQANAYETILTTLQRKSWLSGIYFWKWDPILCEDSIGYSPYNKKASEVLKRFWR